MDSRTELETCDKGSSNQAPHVFSDFGKTSHLFMEVFLSQKLLELPVVHPTSNKLRKPDHVCHNVLHDFRSFTPR